MDLATERETEREPNFEKRFKEWEVVIKKPFLDAERCVRNIVKLLNVYTCISAPFITFRLFWFNFQLAGPFFVPSITGAERSLKLQIQRSDWLLKLQIQRSDWLLKLQIQRCDWLLKLQIQRSDWLLKLQIQRSDWLIFADFFYCCRNYCKKRNHCLRNEERSPCNYGYVWRVYPYVTELLRGLNRSSRYSNPHMRRATKLN